jgi:hypothetical protein
MQHFERILAGALACSALALAMPAQADGNDIARGGTSAGVHLGSFRGAEAASRMLLTLLHMRLAITASEETAWQAFATAVIHEAADADAQVAQPATAANAAEALAQRAAALGQQANDAAAVSQAFTALYGVFTPAQRALVDDYFAHGGLV